jgi:ferrous iron transport protein B
MTATSIAQSASPASDKSHVHVALVGNPNTGKSTLFSALCGVPTRIGNYPGVTVEEKFGEYKDDAGKVTVIDLPGTYSLSARTPDEFVSVDILLGRRQAAPALDAVIVIADATNLERNLYLFTQVQQLGLPTLLVLNMWDRVTAGQCDIQVSGLAQSLGVEIVTTSASERAGVDDVKSALRRVLRAGPRTPPDILPAEFIAVRDELREWIATRASAGPQPLRPIPDFILERMLLDIGGQAETEHTQLPQLNGLSDQLRQYRERLAQSGHRVPAVETKCRYAWIRQHITGHVVQHERVENTLTDRIDRVLTHRWWGLICFALIMFLIFLSIYRFATVFMDGIEAGQGWLSDSIVAAMPPGALRSLITDGIIAGVGSVLVFLPQILILFLFIGILEDCGYMSRAAFVMDKLMTRLGLSGKSFLPLMSSYACAVPGIMATRVIENWRDRMVTILIAPLMSCSARLPVYILLTRAFVPDSTLGAAVLLGMHLVGLVVAVPVAWILKKTFFQGPTPAFVMELPSYKWPSQSVVLFRVWERGQAFVVRAGSLIFLLSILIWAAGYFPGDHTQLDQITAQLEQLPADAPPDVVEPLVAQQREASAALIETSYLGRAGHAIEPIVRPLGWDWKIGVGVLASFPAREVIVSTLGTIYSLGGDVDESDEGLRDALRRATWPDGQPVITVPVALSIMVFFALCAQCAATLMVIRRETNSWWWPIFTFVYMTGLAYLAALIVYQVGSLVG